MSFDINLFSDKLKRCRQMLSLNASEVAAGLGMDQGIYENLENGKLTPTGDQVLMLADFFKQDYQFFISNQQKTASESIQILYRKFGDEFSKEDRWTIQEFIYLCECEQLVFDLQDFKPVDFNFTPIGDYFKKHGLDAAERLRAVLNLKADQLIQDIYYEFRKLGIHIFRRKLSNSKISGLFIMHPWAGKCILVNYDEDIYRQNFTIAHEVAHAIFDAADEINVSYSDWNGKDLKEIRANTFASNFLIPSGAIQKFKGVDLKEEHIVQLAIQLKVNTLPLLIALKEWKIIDYQKYQDLKGCRLSKDVKVDPELIGISERMKAFKLKSFEKGLSSQYVRNAYALYANGEVSSSRLAEMCLINEEELISLLEVFNLKLEYGN